MLRARTIAKFQEVLDESQFTSACFQLRAPRQIRPDGALVEIQYRPRPIFMFEVRDHPEGGFVVDEAPGFEFLTRETSLYKDISDVLDAVARWVDRIAEEDLFRIALTDELEGFREELEERLQAVEADLDVRFTATEAEAMQRSLDEFLDKLADLNRRAGETEERLTLAQQEIEALKLALADQPRGVWYRVAGKRLGTAVKSVLGAAETRQFLLDAAKQLLLGPPKGP